MSGGGTTQQDPLITFTDLPLEGYSPRCLQPGADVRAAEVRSARLAWNWRDDYLISQSDCCIKLPIWQDAYGQLDGSFHFRPSASWDIFLDAQNLTEAETVLRQQVTSDGLLLPRSWFTNDRRLQLSAFVIASSKARVPQKLGAPYTIRRALFFRPSRGSNECVRRSRSSSSAAVRQAG